MLFNQSFDLRFVSDISGTEFGFHLEFEVRGCGDHFIRSSGNFSTPNYPNLYPHNTHCEWTISSEYGTLIELVFLDFDFEASTSCDSDGLTVNMFLILFIFTYIPI